MLRNNFKIMISSFMLLVLSMILFCSNITMVSAAPSTSMSSVITEQGSAYLGKGQASITITANNNQSLVGKNFVLYQLFYAENSVNNESINYTFVESARPALQNIVGNRLNKIPTEVTEYEVIDYIQSLNKYQVEGSQTSQQENGYYSDFRYFVEELRTELSNLGNTDAYMIKVMDTNDDGSVKLDGLAYGYYIIDEVSDNANTHSASSLCMVTTSNPDSIIKIKSDYPNVTKKVKEDDFEGVLENDGWNDIGDYEIGQNIEYKFTSIITNMNGYDTYYYAWHDKMDEALTFDKSSVKIVISDNIKEYILSEREYSIEENVDGDTFVVSVSDLKSIVDDNFKNFDENNHNKYGQKVTLYYSAKLNDKAVSKLSNNGYENDVRLEFSNDPDATGIGKTGFTPWDTVVSYTYQLNGLKVNNHDLKLADAKFRLYRDEKCEKEIFVKNLNGTYVIINEDTATSDKSLVSSVIESDKDGVFNIVGFDSGTYYLKEVDAPAGYRVIQDPIKIEISSEVCIDRNEYIKGTGDSTLSSLIFTANIKQFLDGVFQESTDELTVDLSTVSGKLTVVNMVGTKLPITGSFATIAMIGTGVMIMGITLKKKNKRSA